MKHLTAAESSALSLQLDVLKRQVLDTIRSAEMYDDTVGPVRDHEVRTHADQAEAEQFDEVRFAEMEVNRAKLHDIEQARQRLADGRYGVCIDCDAAIPHKRLLAQPTAIRCAACQSAEEHRHPR